MRSVPPYFNRLFGFSRPTALGYFIVLVLLVLVVVLGIDMSVSRSSGIVEADVVTFAVTGSKHPTRETVARLDDGQVVRASNRTGVTTAAGARVELLEQTGWLSGMRRYSVRRVLPTPPRPGRSDALESFPKPAL